MAAQRSHQNHQSKYATSPWTEAFAMQSRQTPAQPFMAVPDHQTEELQPTHDALVDVYNRDFPAETPGAFYFDE